MEVARLVTLHWVLAYSGVIGGASLFVFFSHCCGIIGGASIIRLPLTLLCLCVRSSSCYTLLKCCLTSSCLYCRIFGGASIILPLLTLLCLCGSGSCFFTLRSSTPPCLALIAGSSMALLYPASSHSICGSSSSCRTPPSAAPPWLPFIMGLLVFSVSISYRGLLLYCIMWGQRPCYLSKHVICHLWLFIFVIICLLSLIASARSVCSAVICF